MATQQQHRALIPLLPPPHPLSSPVDARGLRLLVCGSAGSGKRTLARAILSWASAKAADGDAPKLSIRTRESLRQPSGAKAVTEASRVEFVVFVVDGTQQTDLAELGETLALLPLAWWPTLAVVVTKSFRPQQLLNLVGSYSPSAPVLFSSPSSLPTIGQRIATLVRGSAVGSLRLLEGLRVERPLRFVREAVEEEVA